MNFKANIERVVKAKATVNDGVNAKASASVYTDIGDYNALANKPQINGVTLEGNKSETALGLVTDDDLLHLNDDGESYQIRRAFRQNYNGIDLAWTMYGADDKVLALPSLQGVNTMIADKITADDLPKITVDNVQYSITGWQKYTDSTGIEGIVLFYSDGENDGTFFLPDGDGFATGAAMAIDAAVSQVTPLIPSTWAASDSEGGNAYTSNGILFGQIDSNSTATVMAATVPGLTRLYDGVAVYLMNGVITSASGWTLNVNGLGALPVYQTLAAASRSTTIFNVNYTMLFIYNSKRVEGGCWDIYYGYNSDTNTTAYQVRSNGAGYKAQAKFYRYRLLFEGMDGVHVIPANTSSSTSATAAKTPNSAPFNPFGRIFYYSTTTAVDAEALCSASYLWERYAGLAFGYSFAEGSALTMTYPKSVYLKCTPQSDNSVVLNATEPYVQDLPSSEDGSVYIYLGQATSATAIELAENHPVYQYKSGKICLFTGN